MADNKPGLLLMCHGDFPGNFFTDPRNRRIYEDCVMAMEHVHEALDHPYGDDLTSLSHSMASSVASLIGLKKIKISYLRSGLPDIRRVIANASEKATGTIVCAGAAGLMMPGHNTLELFPGELDRIRQNSPASDIRYTGPCLDIDMATSIVQLSTEDALGGSPTIAAPSFDMNGKDDLSVVLVSSPDIDIRACDEAAEFARTATMLSNRSSRWHDAGICSETSDFMENVSARLQGLGFSAVEAGFIDFASPGIEDAALRLIDKGASHIVVTGVPTLLHRHPLSFINPDDAVKWLRSMIPYATISYLKHEPAFIARLLSGHVASKVLETRSNGARDKL